MKRPHTSSSFPPATGGTGGTGGTSDALLGYSSNNTTRGIQTSEGFRRKTREKNKKQKDNIPQWKIYSSKSTQLYQNTKEKGMKVYILKNLTCDKIDYK